MASKTLEYVPDPNKFDLTVQRWNSQGQLQGKPNHYRKFILGDRELYERPLNSGNLWLENNQPAGRVICEFNEKGHIVSKRFDFEAKHVEFVPPPTGAEKIAAELAAVKAELAAIKKETEAKAEPAKAPPKLTKPAGANG